ncbi:hypothetical protein Bca4012_025515 [Brassica carinata]
MSLEEEEPLVLPDSPRFRVFDANATNLLGRLLNPDCQSMARMINYMPTAWRMVGRVRGIALSRERFQFVFQREEDLELVLKDRPWCYNHCAMVMEKWMETSSEDFLQKMMILVRIRNIPVNYFTTETMFELAKEIGKEFCKLSTPGKIVTIEYEYEKLHKRCFHCLRLTHEKIHCPMLRKGGPSGPKLAPAQSSKTRQVVETLVKPQVPMNIWEGPPGFPPLFPEFSKQENIMALQYISHADETERRARIQRARQGIEDDKAASSIRMARITGDVDKGKGHVFNYLKTGTQSRSDYIPGEKVQSDLLNKRFLIEEVESSFSPLSVASAPVLETQNDRKIICPSLSRRTFSSCFSKKYEKETFAPITGFRQQNSENFQPYGGFRIEAAASPMSITSWNCQGAGSDETVQYLRGLRRSFFPDFPFLMETKQKDDYMVGLQNSLGYDNMISVEPIGLSGGLALIWKSNFDGVVLSSDKRIIDAKVTFGLVSFFLSCVYGDPVRSKRQEFWERLIDIGLRRDEAWLLAADFNEICQMRTS